MLATMELRQQRGLAIVAARVEEIRKVHTDEWRVPSQTVEGVMYRVKVPREGHRTHYQCNCMDFVTRGVTCKHIYAVQFVLSVREHAEPKPRSAPVAVREEKETDESAVTCKRCGSAETHRYGMCGKKQAYWCRPCERKFVVDDGFKRLKGDAKAVTLALDLYFKGVSLRQITDTLEQFFGVEVSHVTIYNWLNRYVSMLNDYAATLRPSVGTEKWHTDEMKIKYGANWRWLWHVMDRETRFLLVSKVTDSRDGEDAVEVFREAVTMADGGTPDTMVTDGLPAYIEASKKVLNTGRKRDARHLREIHLTDGMSNNNIVERLNGTVRMRHKPARGLKSPDGPLTQGHQTYYNLIRPHQAIGEIPGAAAGLPVPKTGNRWKKLIQKATNQNETGGLA